MSLKRKCLAQFVSISLHTPGASLTRRARVAVATEFVEYMFKNNYQLRGIESPTTHHVRLYIEAKRDEGLCVRSLQNVAGHLRRIFEIGGRQRFARDPLISNSGLGIAGSSRRGTNEAVSAAADSCILEAAKRQPNYVLAAVQLQRALGLRALEAVRCGPSLERWEAELIEGQPIYLVAGAKGGKTRYIHPFDRELALNAVRFALEILREAGRGDLFPQTTLRKAIHRYQNVWHRHLTPASMEWCTSHSYRYSYAQDRMIQCLDAGLSCRDTLALVALDLGHGDTRGRYIRAVYGQAVELKTPGKTAE